jgi:hypothetical protein
MIKLDSLRRPLAHRRFVWLLVFLALLLTLPSLWTGLWADDYFHCILLTGNDPLGFQNEPTLDIFRFLDGDPVTTGRMMDAGVAPWWTLPEIKASFFRPLTAVTHWLDYSLWPASPELMHLHSLLWFAALVVAVSALYRLTITPAWIAGLAALLYAVDDARGMPVAWLANRNALIATLLGVLVLIAYIRWRRDGWRWGTWLGPALLIAALAAAEAAIAVGAYLAAYALTLDRGSWLQRFLRLAPYAVIVAVWWPAHHWLGYGTSGSGLYIDPSHEPLQLIQAIVERAPILLLAQIGVPSSSYYALTTDPNGILLWWLLALAVLLVLAAIARPLLKRDPVTRFWIIGMLLAVIPICSTFPHDRLLFFVGLGGMGLVAQLIARPAEYSGRRWYGLVLIVLIGIHMVIAPLNLPLNAWTVRMMDRIMDEDAMAIPGSPEVADQDLIMVNPPIPFLAGYYPVLRGAAQQPIPAHTRILAPGSEPLAIARLDLHSLHIRPARGFISGAMDTLMRSPAYPMQLGDRVELTGMSVEITDLTDDHRPAEAVFRFDRPLDDPSLIWLHWQDGYPVRFTPPPIGVTINLEPQQTLQVSRLLGAQE